MEMIEETEYDEVAQCDHSYSKRCHTTYVTIMSHNKRKIVMKIIGRIVSLSMNKLPSTRQFRSVELLWSRIVTFRDLRFAGLSMSQSAGPSRRFMM